MNAVRKERTGWRDAELSLRHREWGFNCPSVDLDFVMVEYKKDSCMPFNVNHPTYKALVALANGYSPGPLPCFIAMYNAADWSFVVTPLNDCAEAHYRHVAGTRISEARFVKSLFLLRKKTLDACDEEAIAKLNQDVIW